MKHAFVQRNGARRLIVIFAGWGMDARPFAGLTRPGYDIAVVWDYREPDLDPALAAGYDEVCVLAWSMGVMAAGMCHNALGPNVTARIAVGGTPCPVSDTEGIPTGIFDATLSGLDARSLERFMRRMCGGARAFADFAPRMPLRPVDELRDELAAIGRRAADADSDASMFDHYVLTLRDAIFPSANQHNAFAGRCDIVERDYAHLPDFQELLDEFFIDKTLVAERFDSAKDSYDANAEAQNLIAGYLAGMLGDKDIRTLLGNAGAQMLEIGCGTGLLSRRLLGMHPAAQLHFTDIAPCPPQCIGSAPYTCADAETAVMAMPDASLDLIVSSSTMQWFNSPQRFVRECVRVLRPGGFLAVSTFGKDNLQEIATTVGVGLHLAPVAVWDNVLRAIDAADVIILEQKTVQCRFGSAAEALRSLSRTGVNAISRHGRGARSALSALHPDSKGLYTLSYQPLFILLRKNR